MEEGSGVWDVLDCREGVGRREVDSEEGEGGKGGGGGEAGAGGGILSVPGNPRENVSSRRWW